MPSQMQIAKCLKCCNAPKVATDHNNLSTQLSLQAMPANTSDTILYTEQTKLALPTKRHPSSKAAAPTTHKHNTGAHQIHARKHSDLKLKNIDLS